MVYETPLQLRTALEARLQNASRERGVRLDRLRSQAVFERILVRLDVAQPGVWILKGGTALELRLRDRARTTRDLDLARRHTDANGDGLRDLLIGLLANDPDGDRFRFEVGPAVPVAPGELGRRGWRFLIVAQLVREFARVRVDIVQHADEITATERLELPGALAFAGIATRTVEAVAPAQVFAEKLHALTRSYATENSRVRDLIDLVLIIEDGLRREGVLAVTRHVFAARATHDLPKSIPSLPAFWDEPYAVMASELTVNARSVAAARALVDEFWKDVLREVWER